MGSTVSGTDEPPTLTADEIALLTKRVQAVQKVTDMAAGGAVRLLGHTRQLESTLDQVIQCVEMLPDLSRISLLEKRIESLQAMLDWVVTRSAPDSNPLDFVEVQTHLSMCRVRLVNVQSEIRQAAALARSLPEARETLTALVSEVETLESTKAKAETLLLESRVLISRLEGATEAETNLNYSG
jgi:hypothetical protein